MFIIFKLIDKFIGLRVPAEVEIDGLDIHEHGLASAYAGFSISDANSAAMVPNENTDLGEDDVTKATDKQISAAVPVVREPSPVIHDGVYDTGMHKVSIIAKSFQVRSAQDCPQRSGCDRHDRDPGDGLRHPEGHHREIPRRAC